MCFFACGCVGGGGGGGGGGVVLFAHLETRCVNLMTSFASQFTDVMKDNVYISVVVSDILRNEKRQSRGGFAFILVECWHPVAIIQL